MKLNLPPQKDDHMLGPSHAHVTLVVYADFQCPHSKKANAWIHELLKSDSDLRFIYRHFPLINLHAYAVYAALASEAGGLQGQFWPYQRELFNAHELLTPSLIISLAQKIGLEVPPLITAMNDESVMEKVFRDFSSGFENGIQSTPTFFINGFRIEGPINKESLLRYIDCTREGKILPA
jgi:protein-disulfide isomerase